MKTAVVLLCVVAAASASPVWPSWQSGTATGGANANIVQGLSPGASISSLSASAGGSASGGGSSFNRGNARLTSASNIFGSSNSAQTSAQSNQFTQGRPFFAVRRPYRIHYG